MDTELQTVSENGLLLESALKRTVYSYPKQHILPLHVYLRYRNITFQEAVSEFCPPEQVGRIFFESGEENVKKMVEIVKKYLKKNKNYISRLD